MELELEFKISIKYLQAGNRIKKKLIIMVHTLILMSYFRMMMSSSSKNWMSLKLATKMLDTNK